MQPSARSLFESDRVLFLPIGAITPNPAQPRSRFSRSGLEELAGSIAIHGILQPLSVRRLGEGRFQLISGERRLRAARMAGLDTVPCILVSATDLQSSLLALVENLQRRDLDFLEEARALRRLILEFGLSQEEAARRVGKSQSAVANKLRLLKLAPELLDALKRFGLTERHARALLRLSPSQRPAALQHIAAEGLNVAQTDRYIDSLLAPPAPAAPAPPEPAPARRQPIFLLQDVRFFLNTLDRGLQLMRRAGVPATARRTEDGDKLVLTIEIPRHPTPPRHPDGMQ